MTRAPTIRGSAQARLLLYRLLSSKLTETEERLLLADPASWEQLITLLEKGIVSDAEAKSVHAVLTQAFAHIERGTREGLQRQIERLSGQSLWLGIHPTSLLDAFIDEHQKLLTSIKREHLDKVAMNIKHGIREGRLQKDIVQDIRRSTNLSKRRAQLIARNAPLQYGGALTKHHQMSAGIKKYRWQTSQDERVRNSHRSRNNVVFSWDSPGPHPRSEVNCRCDAVPVLE